MYNKNTKLMAVVHYAGNRITGLTADTKPTNVREGALFFELDGDKRVFEYLNGAWEILIGADVSINLSYFEITGGTLTLSAAFIAAVDVNTGHRGQTNNPHSVTKSQVGLGDVDNVQQYPNSNPSGFETPAELNARDSANRNRANHTGTQGAATISDFDTAVVGNTEVSQNTTHRGLTNNPHSVTKTQVGLGNVDNTSDADKPVSTAQQAALNLKANGNEVVKLTGAQSVGGVKTFTDSPVVPAPITDLQAATKKYVDDNAGGGIELTSEITSSTTLASGHANKYIPVNSASDLNITIDGSVFSENDQIVLEQTGNGVITLVEGSGMTLNGGLSSMSQYKVLTIFFKSATVATVIGGE